MSKRGLKIYFDGGCRPNPGKMETAVVVGGVVHLQLDCGYGTSNDAEWLALIHAAEIALAIGASDVVFLGDSAIVVDQALGRSKCRGEALQAHRLRFLEFAPRFDRIRIRRISRHQNLAGIALARQRL